MILRVPVICGIQRLITVLLLFPAVCRPGAMVLAAPALGIAVPDNELSGAGMAAELDDYVTLGAGWFRTDFRWSFIQPAADGPYNWSRNDAIVDSAMARGLNVLALVHSVPSWVVDNGGLADTSNVAAFAAFTQAAVARYKDRISHWEIWNEPNLSGFWGGQAPDPDVFCDLLVRGAAAVRAADPDAFIISAGLSPAPDPTPGDPWYGVKYLSARTFVEAIYAHGADTAFDAFGYHPYAWPLMPDNTDPWNGWYMMENMVRDNMVAGGDSLKPVWLTEFGAPSLGTAALTESSQVQQLQIACERMADLPWAGPLFWYSYRDRGGDTSDTENWFGLRRPDGSAKPVYDAFRALTVPDTVPPDTARGLVAHWPLDGDAADATGSGHDGTVTGATAVAGMSGQAYLFGDSTDMIRIPHHADLSFGNSASYTVSLWANPVRLRSAWTAVLSKSRDAAPWYGVYINTDDRWDFRGITAGAEGGAAAPGTWTHIAGVQDGPQNTRTIYVNGVEAGTGAAGPADGTGDLVIGNVLGAGGEAFEGIIDEVRIYDRALSSEEVDILASVPVAGVRPVVPAVRRAGYDEPGMLYDLQGNRTGIGSAAPGILLRYSPRDGMLCKILIQ